MNECTLYLSFLCDDLNCAEKMIKFIQILFSEFVKIDDDDTIFHAYIFSNRDNKFIEKCNVTKVEINA